VGEQSIAREQGSGFVEGFVTSGTTAAEVVIIHAGEVIVDKRIRVDAFEGDGGWERIAGGVVEELGGGEGENGTEAFAAGLKTVAHRFMKAGGPGRCGRQEKIEGGFDAGGVGGKAGGEIHRRKRVLFRGIEGRQGWPRALHAE
jgi:hypothetical protein